MPDPLEPPRFRPVLPTIRPLNETTQLSPEEYQQFMAWAAKSGIPDVIDPQSLYDYRGYWKDVASKGRDQTKMYEDGPHFPDTYKRHGHPTFSIESKYSMGRGDGGRWDGETYIPQQAPKPTLEDRLAAHADATRVVRRTR